MEKNAANHFSMILQMPIAHKDDLFSIRHWPNVKLALADGFYWAKDFTDSQQTSVELKVLPYKSIFHLQGNQLFPAGSLLPVGHLPNGLLWTPIEKALPIHKPSLNHYLFEVQDTIDVRLIAATQEESAVAMMVDVQSLRDYIQQAPAVRIQHLTWVLLANKALIMGAPLLPIQGEVYWLCENMLLPTGYAFEWPIIAKTIAELIAATDTNWVLWHKDGSYTIVPKRDLSALSISSFRLSTGSVYSQSVQL